MFSARWLLFAIFFVGDISAHFNPAMMLAFTLRRVMGWAMVVADWIVQFAAAIAVLVAHVLRGPAKAQEDRTAMGDPSASS